MSPPSKRHINVTCAKNGLETPPYIHKATHTVCEASDFNAPHQIYILLTCTIINATTHANLNNCFSKTMQIATVKTMVVLT